MKEKLKTVLNGAGLLNPLRRLRRSFSRPSSPEDPHAGFVSHARRFGMELVFKNSRIVVRNGGREIWINPKHEIYLWDMINCFDYYHGAVHPKQIKKTAVVDYSRPSVHRLTRSGIEFEFSSLPESDETTEAYLNALGLKSGEVVFDLGAYAGASAYFFAKAVGPDGIVVSFEPDEINFPCLQANIKRHGLANVRPVAKGVWSETTNLEFQAEGNMGSSPVSVTGRKSNVTIVPVISLADAARLVEGRRVAAIKMDIEGAELAVLRNADEFLRQHRPRLVIEPHIVDGKMVTEEICQILARNGYRFELLQQGLENIPLIVAQPAEI